MVAITVIAIIAGSFGVMQFLVKTKPESSKSPNRKTILGVKTMAANPSDYSVEMHYPARVTPRQVVSLNSEVSGRIIAGEIDLKIGSRFKKGDVIVKIFNDDVVASLMAQKSQFLNIISKSLPDINIDFPDQYDKWYNFFTNIDIAKPLPALPSIDSNKEKVYISSKEILTSYYNILNKEIILSRYDIVAPFNGIFTAVSKEVGSTTATHAEIAKITSTDNLELVVGVSLEDAQKLSIGTRVEVRCEENEHYTGRIERIAAFVDNTTQRVNVYVSLFEPGMDIIEGQLLSVTMPSVELDDVVEISREAIVGDTMLYVVKDDKLNSRKVSVVSLTNSLAYVTGINMGDTIVNESLVAPYEGMSVKKLDMQGEPVNSQK